MKWLTGTQCVVFDMTGFSMANMVSSLVSDFLEFDQRY